MRAAVASTVARQFGLFAILWALGSGAQAGDGCCAQCGCTCECRKTCRLECTEKKITTVCWTYQGEDFCLPGPSRPACAHIDCACDECSEPDEPEAAPKLRYWREWVPSRWSKVHSRRRLMKQTVTKTVPSYKWVVEELCLECQAGYESVSAPQGVTIPMAPAVDDAKIIAVDTKPARK